MRELDLSQHGGTMNVYSGYGFAKRFRRIGAISPFQSAPSAPYGGLPWTRDPHSKKYKEHFAKPNKYYIMN